MQEDGQNAEKRNKAEQGSCKLELCPTTLLTLFASNVGDHVVQDVHTADPGITSARDCLHGNHADLVNDAKFRL